MVATRDDRNPASHLDEAQGSEISRKSFSQQRAFAKSCAGPAKKTKVAHGNSTKASVCSVYATEGI